MNITSQTRNAGAMVFERNDRVSYDIESYLLSQRIIMLEGEVNNVMNFDICNKLLYLANQSDEPITLYINSPGGSCDDGLAIVDVMKSINAPVIGVVKGIAMSMGAIIITACDERKAYCDSKFLIHQPLGSTEGQATQMAISLRSIEHTKKRLYNIISETTGQPYDKVFKDCERDNYLTAKEALDYGLIDEIIEYSTAEGKKPLTLNKTVGLQNDTDNPIKSNIEVKEGV